MPFKKGTVINKNYIIVKFLFQGSVNNTYLVKRAADNKRFILKELLSLKSKKMDKDNLRNIFFREAEVMAKFNHPGLPLTHGIFNYKNKEYHLMEYVKGKTLEEVLKNKKEKVDEEDALKWFLELSEIFEYLHTFFQCPVIYRNLKPSNIIFTKEGKIKLIDFSRACFYKPYEDDNIEISPLPGYGAPEEYKKEVKITPQSDIFSLGVILYQLLTRYNPPEKPCPLPKLNKKKSPFPQKLADIIDCAVELNPEKRYRDIESFKKNIEKYMGIYVEEKQSGFLYKSGCAIILTLLSALFILLIYISVDLTLEICSIHNLYFKISLVGAVFIIFSFFMYKGFQIDRGKNALMVITGIVFLIFVLLLPYIIRVRSELQFKYCQGNLKRLGTALEMYSAYDKNFNYPPSLDYLTENYYKGNPYIKEIPRCPLCKMKYGYICSNDKVIHTFTLWCSSPPGSHKAGGEVSSDGKWPQYVPVDGIKVR